MEKQNRSEQAYEDILYLPHPVSSRHPQMPLEDRAAQFAPFAALTGHSDAIEQKARDVAQRYEGNTDRAQELWEEEMSRHE